MAKVLPPDGFAGVNLHIYRAPAGQQFGRIYLWRYPDPLGFGKTPSCFSDRRDGAIGDLPIAEAELHARHYAEIEVTTPLEMVDLREDGAIVMGVPTDVAKSSRQTLARAWSVAFHEHPEKWNHLSVAPQRARQLGRIRPSCREATVGPEDGSDCRAGAGLRPERLEGQRRRARSLIA